MSLPVRVVFMFMALFAAMPASAYRREYAVTWEGQQKAGSELCFYRGVAGDPFTLFFSSGNVRCLPADAILDFPPGVIHAFARHREGFTSLHRDYVIFDGPPGPERGYEKLETPLVRAGTVDFSGILKRLGIRQRVGVWIGSSPASMGTFFPIVSGETTIMAPAEVPLVPLIVENGLPIMVGEPLYVSSGETQPAIFKEHPGTSDLILWTRLDAASSEDAKGVLEVPSITLKAGDRILRPVIPLYGQEANTLLFFRGVPAGTATLTTHGSMWKPVTREITVSARPVTIEHDAIPLVVGGSVVVRWVTEGVHAPLVDCSPVRTNDVPQVRAALLRCTITEAGQKKCSPVAEMIEPYDGTASGTFEGISAGAYTLAIEPPYGKRQSVPADVVSGKQTTLHVTFPSFTFFGTATLNRKPVHARLVFASGQAVSDLDGRYTAVLPADPLLNQIQVEPCGAGRTFTFIPRTAPMLNAVYDVNVQLASLEVQVVDPQRHPVAGASVIFSPIKQVLPDGHEEVYFGSEEKVSGERGEVAFDDVPAGFAVGVCARHPRFVLTCKSFDLAKLDGPAVVQFEPVGMRGHVEGHAGEGYVTIVNPAGIVTEDVHLDRDGSFLFRTPHAAPEYLIYVSSTRPLAVLPLPLIAPADLTVQVPNVPARTFTVTMPNMQAQSGFVGIWVGGRYVPLQVFNTHMELRSQDLMLYRGKSLTVRDIAETGPITVSFAVPDPAATTFVDVFTLPQYAGITQHPVKGSTVTLPQN